MRRQCRMAMNGIASASMRNHGLGYKLNFGVSLMKIKEISKCYQPDASLAESLWLEQTRELKILATLLYPSESFGEQNAERWLSEIHNQEIREQLCMNLLQNTPFADKLASAWSDSDADERRITGYWLMARLYKVGKAKPHNIHDFRFIRQDLICDNITLNNAAISCAKMIGRQTLSDAHAVVAMAQELESVDNAKGVEVYESLKFEFDFYFPLKS